MKFINNKNVIDIMQNTLNFVDSRLIDHGKRVAYLVYKMLEPQNKYSEKELHDICILALLHDIGAYKTEEIDKMAEFETVDVWEHSIYGYLFLKYFSPLKDLAPIILFHHADCSTVSHLPPSSRNLAQTLFLCDRIDVYYLTRGNMDGFSKYIMNFRDTTFQSDIIDMFFMLNVNVDEIDEKVKSDEKFLHILYNMPMTKEEAEAYIKMTIFSIESRSSQTVLHSIAAVCVSEMLARLSGLDDDDIEEITTAAILHDIGKTGIPVSILESNERLSDIDMTIMKTHVDMTEKIITGCVDEVIKQIAVRHHEKLNGTGYPRKLSSDCFSLNDRILIIADIFSALCQSRSYKAAWPKEKIIGIISNMSSQGLIDFELTHLAVTHFDEIMEALNQKTQPVLKMYQIVKDEYAQLKDKVKRLDFEGLIVYTALG